MTDFRQLWEPCSMKKSLRNVLTVLALVAASPLVLSQACESRFQVKFADGQQGCLTDFALATEEVQSYHSSVKQMASPSGTYNIASTARDQHCPAALGMVTIRISSPGSNNPDNLTKARSAKALRACQAQLDAAPAAEPRCSCQIVFEDGMSPLTRSQFTSHIGGPVGTEK